MRQLSSYAQCWLLDVMRIVAGIIVAIAIMVLLYVNFYDPLVFAPDAVHGEMLSDRHARFYLTGHKRHDNCPGSWQLLAEDQKGFWTITSPKPTGDLPPGLMNAVPIDAWFDAPLAHGTYTARLLIEYRCLLPFRHQLSFELIYPKVHRPDGGS